MLKVMKKYMFNKAWLIILIALFFFTTIIGCSQSNTKVMTTEANLQNSDAGLTKAQTSDQFSLDIDNSNVSEQRKTVSSDGTLKVCFIDVGQADSILVQSEGEALLIDAGNNDDATMLINYLKEQGVTKLDYIIGTHPHEDHIGSLDSIINTFQVGKIIMPKAITTTKTFQDVLIAIKNKGLTITVPVAGSSFSLGKAVLTILAPNSDKYEDLNNYSVVVKLTYGNTSFLFTGDAESISEEEMLSKGYDLSADVLKVGHHGSESATTSAFLSKVNPKYAVISVGRGNDYGHPHKETLNKLYNAKVQIFRTDENGTIVAVSDGKSVKFNVKTSKTQISSQATQQPQNDGNAKDRIVYITKTGTRYHKDGCPSLSKSKIPISLSEAINKGYEPCSKCNP